MPTEHFSVKYWVPIIPKSPHVVLQMPLVYIPVAWPVGALQPFDIHLRSLDIQIRSLDPICSL
jgi:hypothetical protein